MNIVNFDRRYLLTIFLALFVISGCSDNDPYKDRFEAVTANKDTLKIALAWPLEQDNRGTKTTILQGVQLAVKEVNAGGGVLGRKLKIVQFDDGRSINEGLILAQTIAEDKSLFAVIGHLDSYVSVPTSTTYEFSGLITLNPGSTDAQLTQAGYEHLFRLIPKDAVQGEELAKHFKANGIKKVVVYYVNNSYGRELANSFERQALDLDLSIVDRRAYDKSSREHFRTMSDWRKFYKFDAIFLAGSMPEGTDIIREAKEAGITEKIYTGAGLDSRAFIDQGGADVENTYVVSFFPLNNDNSNVQRDFDDSAAREFSNAYQAEFGSPPTEAAAALGYDAVKLLAMATKKAGNLHRDQVAEAIRLSQGWVGSTGPYHFDESGDVDDKLMVINQVIDGNFTFSYKIN